MKDKSGRDCVLGDLVVCFKNKAKLEGMEYALVIADGKVFNGSENYTVNDNAYLCAMTPSEQEIKKQLYTIWVSKSQDKIKRKELAKQLKPGSIFKKNRGLGIYLGVVSIDLINSENTPSLSVYKKPSHAYFYLYTENYRRGSEAKALLQKIKDNGLDMSTLAKEIGTLENINQYLGSFESGYSHVYEMFVTVSKIQEIEEVVGSVNLLNWNAGDYTQFPLPKRHTDKDSLAPQAYLGMKRIR